MLLVQEEVLTVSVVQKKMNVLKRKTVSVSLLRKANISAKEPASRINEALGKLVAMQYNKLTYMETAPELSDIAAVFNGNDGQLSFLGTSDTTPNKLAL